MWCRYTKKYCNYCWIIVWHKGFFNFLLFATIIIVLNWTNVARIYPFYLVSQKDLFVKMWYLVHFWLRYRKKKEYTERKPGEQHFFLYFYTINQVLFVYISYLLRIYISFFGSVPLTLHLHDYYNQTKFKLPSKIEYLNEFGRNKHYKIQ